MTIQQEDILFQGNLQKLQQRTNQKKNHFFVLTKENLFFLKSEEEPIIISVMPSEWVRTDYIYKKRPNSS